MRKLMLSALAFTLASSAAFAESETAWPRYPYQGIQATEPGTVYTAPAAGAVNVWVDAFVPFGASAAATSADKGGQSPTPAAELDAQMRGYRAYWVARNRELITADGELAGVLPVRVHERLNAKAFGSPVMQGAQ